MRPHYIKTTVELPEELMRFLQMRSVQRGQTLQETIAEVIKNGLFDTGDRTPVKLRPPIKSLDGRPFTLEEVQRAKEEGRL